MSENIDTDFILLKPKRPQVLVTGGGVGIGKMIATGFAKNGATVYIAARKEPQLKEVYEFFVPDRMSN